MECCGIDRSADSQSCGRRANWDSRNRLQPRTSISSSSHLQHSIHLVRSWEHFSGISKRPFSPQKTTFSTPSINFEFYGLEKIMHAMGKLSPKLLSWDILKPKEKETPNCSSQTKYLVGMLLTGKGNKDKAEHTASKINSGHLGDVHEKSRPSDPSKFGWQAPDHIGHILHNTHTTRCWKGWNRGGGGG